MPPVTLPRIRRTDANHSLTNHAFVLRLGRANRPVLTAVDDAGRPVHVPLHYDAKTDTYSIGALGMFLTKASCLRGLYNRAIPAVTLQETIESIFKGEPPPPAGDEGGSNFISFLTDGDVCQVLRQSEEHRAVALDELARRYDGLPMPHRPVERADDDNLVRYFEEASRLRAIGVTLSRKRPVVQQLVEAAIHCLHGVRFASRFTGTLPTALTQVDDAAFILSLVTGEASADFNVLCARLEVHAHRGDTRDTLCLLARLACAMPEHAAPLARRVACIAAEQDRAPLLTLVSTLYPASVLSTENTGPMAVAVAFGSTSAVRTLLDAGINLPRRILLSTQVRTRETLTRQAQNQQFGAIIQPLEDYAADRALLERRMEVLSWCLDVAP